ncbi:hypothetical protein DFA_10784 [Cavenderia fasciculata]|uniref:Uncharacterized protein n=1 Tax=Cavenderia fasciculata TaxID=261658 RepID=F4QBD9_CACFS|nr:uncharacterized protein DFA_10784 [Cavenderia fasciculata]EGG14911.1 hypothetical protein DFA_10784 [Cavenderia fasciculata]|eukprot:XP_004351427.1 hypothetical protein DFA_10784 [Cavenderia fasciculata]
MNLRPYRIRKDKKGRRYVIKKGKKYYIKSKKTDKEIMRSLIKELKRASTSHTPIIRDSSIRSISPDSAGATLRSDYIRNIQDSNFKESLMKESKVAAENLRFAPMAILDKHPLLQQRGVQQEALEQQIPQHLLKYLTNQFDDIKGAMIRKLKEDESDKIS